MSQIPLLLISDSVTSPSGLARITRELASRIHAHLSETFEVATAGYGGTYSRQYPWKQYPFQRLQDWTIPELPGIWNDFAGERKGVILAVWNHSWLPWMANPNLLPDGDLKSFLKSGRCEFWLYAPIDAEGPNGKLDNSQAAIFQGFDRVLAYTKFGADIIDRTCDWGKGITEHLPHGTDDTLFYPRDRREARSCFIEKVVQNGKGLISEDVLLLSAIATNTPRKDWGLFFEVCGELLSRGVNVGAWCHTDRFQKPQCWDLRSLAYEFGMKQRTIFTNGHLSDDDMAWGYAACDCVLGIASGGGWELPLAEALACQIPVVTGNYSGPTEFVSKECLIEPVGFRFEGYYSNRRPVFRASDWAYKVMELRGQKIELDPKFYWKNCWPKWSEWLLDGVR
jgi:glycosyltransferase involved in cell wall biosynthesis